MNKFPRILLFTMLLGIFLAAASTAMMAQSVPGLAPIDRRLIQYTQKTLTNAQVLALGQWGGQQTIIPAYGTGTVIEPLGGILSYHYTGAYTVGGSDDLKFYSGTRATGPAVSGSIETTGFLDQTANTVINFGGVPANEILTPNTAVVLQTTSGANFGGGNALNTLIIRIAYRVHNN